jgi:hypothetical protein
MKSLFLVIAIIFSCTLAFAQDMQAAEKRATKYSETLSKDLSLKEDQKVKVQKIIKESEVEIEKIKANNALSTSEKNKQIDSVLKTEKSEMKKILTTEQFSKYNNGEASKARINTSRSSIKQKN